MANLSAKRANVFVLSSSPWGGSIARHGHYATTVPLRLTPGETLRGNSSLVIGIVALCYHCVPFSFRRSIVLLSSNAEGNTFQDVPPMNHESELHLFFDYPMKCLMKTGFLIYRGPQAMGPNLLPKLILGRKGKSWVCAEFVSEFNRVL